MKIDWKIETKPFVELIAACLLSFILVLGFVYNIFKPFWDYRKLSIKGRFEAYLKWYEDMVIQTIHVVFYLFKHVLVFTWYFLTLRFWKSIKHIVHEIARAADLLGNVFAGEMIEDLVTPIEKTYFGLGEITISAATGYLEQLSQSNPKALNKFGWWITKTLNKAFNEEKHSVWSWEREIRDHAIYGHENYLDTII